MADSIRQKITDAVSARLALIKTVNGYETDLGLKVFEWRVAEIPESDLPAAVYRDIGCDTSDSEGSSMGYHLHSLNMEIELFASGSTSPATMRKMIADVFKAIGVDDTWGGLALTTRPQGDKADVEQEEKKFTNTLVSIVVEFETLAWDAYTQ